MRTATHGGRRRKWKQLLDVRMRRSYTTSDRCARKRRPFSQPRRQQIASRRCLNVFRSSRQTGVRIPTRVHSSWTRERKTAPLYRVVAYRGGQLTILMISFQGCRGYGISIPIPSHTHRKSCWYPHRIPIPTEPQNPTYPYPHPVFSIQEAYFNLLFVTLTFGYYMMYVLCESVCD